MGGDGGSIPTRDVLAQTKKAKKTAAQVTFGRSILLDWTHCSLTKQRLSEPICCDDLGNLYNKTALIEAMLNKTLPKQLKYIKKIKKDIINCNITLRDNLDKIDINNEENGGIFMCPISGLIGNGKYPFVCLRKCGCILSKRTLKNIKGNECLNCGKKMDQEINDYTRIPINSSNEYKEKLFKDMLQRKQNKKKLKEMKKQCIVEKKVDEHDDEEDIDLKVNHNKNKTNNINIKLSKKEKKMKRKKLMQELEDQQKKDKLSGHKRLLDAADESVKKKMKTSHVFASIFDRKQRDFNFAGGGTGF